MAAFIRELPESRNFDIGPDAIGFETKWFVWNAINEVEVEAVAFANTPTIYRRLIRQKIRAEEVATGSGSWFVTIPYGTIDRNRMLGADIGPNVPPDANGPLNGPNSAKFSFDTMGEPTHITQSLGTVSASDSRHEPGLADRDTNQAIGVSNEGVKGCEVLIPKLDWTLELPFPFIPMSYIIALYSLTGTVNHEQRFCGFEMGEVLFRGATGSFTYDDRWTITHYFSSKPNRKDVNLNGVIMPTPGTVGTPVAGGVIKIPEVRGWDYLWCEYVMAKVGTRMMQVPSKAYVERVYPTGDFSILTGGPQILQKRLRDKGVDPNDGGFFADMSKHVKNVSRYEPKQGPGTLVEWSWSDPRLPDN